MEFKKSLAEHFKRFEASPMLFIGSGVSRRYLGTENWEQLLLRFCNAIEENPLKLKASSNGDPTKYAQLLAKSYEERWWGRPDSNEVAAEFAEHFTTNSSILKIEISRYLRGVHEGVNQELQHELSLLEKVNIDGVITTNWDRLLETIFPKFTTFIGQDGLISGRSHGIAEIYKIHGCSSTPNSLVLTEEDYAEYRRKNPYLSSKLLTIFIERPVIFLGYSLADPHIADILEDIIGCFPEKSLEFLRDKLIFVEWHPELDEPTITDSVIHKRIPVKLIRVSSFVELYEVLAETKKRIPAHIFRRIKDELYELVLTDDPKGQLFVRNESDLESDDSLTEYVVGYGAISTLKKGEAISKQGLIGLSRSDLIRDIIFETNKFDPLDVVSTVLPNLAKGNIKLPIFYYLNRAGYLRQGGVLNSDLPPLCAGAKSRFDVNLFAELSGGAEFKRSKTVPEVTAGINELYHSQEFDLFLRMVPYMDPKLIKAGLPDLVEILRKHVDTSHANSGFARLVCFYDLVRYSNRY
ncbi:SIR2 family protein [Pseudomonas oryzihabitans]|uniref:SIR2 family protein n=1 Tax=Pseudomonas oryzihabitans TaxID=47885 RepID=UPI002B1E78A4|nr:SIR2 family protein [Pseudomonas oryzihabitans]